MTDRKFTPPTTFSAEYVDGRGERVVILGVAEGGGMLVGYYPDHNAPGIWHPDGSDDDDEGYDLHDIPKRVRLYEVRSITGGVIVSHTELDEATKHLREDRYFIRYITRYECDEDGSNPTITRIPH